MTGFGDLRGDDDEYGVGPYVQSEGNYLSEQGSAIVFHELFGLPEPRGLASRENQGSRATHEWGGARTELRGVWASAGLWP